MKKIIGIVTPILLLILPYLLFVVLSVGMGRPDRDSSGAYIMAGDSRLQMTQTAICIVYTVVVLLNVVWVIYQPAAGTGAQALLLWDMLLKLCYIPYYLLAAAGREVKLCCPWGQQLPCRYCTLSLCWTLWRRSSDSVPYTADTNARNRWHKCHLYVEQNITARSRCLSYHLPFFQ